MKIPFIIVVLILVFILFNTIRNKKVDIFSLIAKSDFDEISESAYLYLNWRHARTRIYNTLKMFFVNKITTIKRVMTMYRKKNKSTSVRNLWKIKFLVTSRTVTSARVAARSHSAESYRQTGPNFHFRHSYTSLRHHWNVYYSWRINFWKNKLGILP